jgi:hypothetical protein
MSSIGRRAFARILLLASGLAFVGACGDDLPTARSAQTAQPSLSFNPNVYYVIRNASTQKVMDVENAGCCNGYFVHQWTYEGRTNQQWRIVDVGGGYYKVVARHSGRVLDVRNASLSDGARVHQWGYDGSANQQFAILFVGGGGGIPDRYLIVARHSGKALAVDGFYNSINENGVGVRQVSGSDYAIWQLELVP